MDVCQIKHIELKPLTFCRYSLTVLDKNMYLSFPQLLRLRQKLNNITLPEKLLKVIENENFVLLFVADGEHLLFLEIPQLLKLQKEVSSYFNVVNNLPNYM